MTRAVAKISTAPVAEPWEELLATGREDERLVHDDRHDGRAGRHVTIPEELNPLVQGALAAAGIETLYAHQAQAIYSAFQAPTIVTTGTASGKSLCFQLPALQVLTEDRNARALFLYPTKALAQDQARSLTRFGLARQLRPAIYDGDTPRHERSAIRKKANLVITNPDMLHVGILPHHDAWGDFFANLAFVVVDEAHVYRGVFGSHVGNVLRRLRRAAADPRHRAALPAHQRHDRQPVELATDAHRPARLQPDRRRRRAPRRAPDRDVEPAAAGREARRSAPRRCTRRPRSSPS